jgi:pyruvate dehydrogenase E1 component beta subunit
VDAKGLLLSSILSDDPVLFIEGRSLYSMEEDVPDEPYLIPLGEALVRRRGDDITIVSIGSLIPAALQAADTLASKGISAEVVDLRCLMPLDVNTVAASVARTGRLVVCDPGWRMYGASAEIIASVVEMPDIALKASPRRVTWPHSHVPTSAPLEAAYYPTGSDIERACLAAMGRV